MIQDFRPYQEDIKRKWDLVFFLFQLLHSFKLSSKHIEILHKNGFNFDLEQKSKNEFYTNCILMTKTNSHYIV